MTTLSVRFWGVRGGVATGNPEFAGIGGNTSCVEVRAGEEIIILDAGTGLARLGRTLESPARAAFFISHFHWDHIQGFPFFGPGYCPENAFTLYGSQDFGGLEAALARQMLPPHFPVTLSAMRAQLTFRSISHGEEVTVGAAHVRAAALNHPQGCLGFRISYGGVRVVYATDTEHLAPGVADPAALALARDADLLILDAQYTDDEYAGRCGPPRKGWGHSTIREACQLARTAKVKQLVLFHHDPTHDDRHIDRLGAEAQRLFANVVVAREGMTLSVMPPTRSANAEGALAEEDNRGKAQRLRAIPQLRGERTAFGG